MEKYPNILSDELRRIRDELIIIKQDLRDLRFQISALEVRNRKQLMENLDTFLSSFPDQMENVLGRMKFTEERIIAQVNGELTLLKKEVQHLGNELRDLKVHMKNHQRTFHWIVVGIVILILFQISLFLILL